jgi:hypothetical protein
MLAAAIVCIASLVLVAAASAGGHRYIVVLKEGKTRAGLAAVAKAGGKVVHITPQIGVATVVARDGFGAKLRATGAVDGVALNAAWDQPELKPQLSPAAVRQVAAAAARTPPPVPAPDARRAAASSSGTPFRGLIRCRSASGTCGKSTRRRPTRTR